MGKTTHYQLLMVCAVRLLFAIEGSSGFSISPTPAAFLVYPPPDGMRAPVQRIGSVNKSVVPISESQPNGTSLYPPVAPSPLNSNAVTQGLVPHASPDISSGPPNITSPSPAVSEETLSSISPSRYSASPSQTTAPPPVMSQGPAPPVLPIPPESKAPVALPNTPVASPADSLPPSSSVIHLITPSSPPPSSHQNSMSSHGSPVASAVSPVAAPPETSEQVAPPAGHHIAPAPVLSTSPVSVPITTVASPANNLPPSSSVIHPPTSPSLPPSSDQHNTSSDGAPVAGSVSPVADPPEKSEQVAPAVHQVAPPPLLSISPVSVPITPVASPSDNLPPSPSVIQPITLPSPPSSSGQNHTSSHGGPVAGAVSPFAAPPEKSEQIAPEVHQIAPPPMLSTSPGPNITLPPYSAPPESIDPKAGVTPLAGPPPAQPPVNHPPTNGSSAIAPSTHKSTRHSDAPVPSRTSTESPTNQGGTSPAPRPPTTPRKRKYSKDRVNDPAPASSYLTPPPKHQGQAGSTISPSMLPNSPIYHAAPPFIPGESGPSATPVPQYPTPADDTKFVPSPSPKASSRLNRMPVNSPKVSPSRTSPTPKVPLPPYSAPPESIDPKANVTPLAAPPAQPPVNHPPTNGSSAITRSTHKSMRHSDAPVPSRTSTESPANQSGTSPAPTPPITPRKEKHSRDRVNDPAPASSYLIPPPKHQDQAGSPMSPSLLPTRQMYHAAPPFKPGELGPSSATPFPQYPTPADEKKLVPSPSPKTSSGLNRMPVNSPKVSPSRNSPSPKVPLPPPIFALPPPPPNQDCSSTVCIDPYTNSPPGSPCGCVLPMQVGLRLSVDLYTFFPLVSELALEIADGVFMKQSQVKIMGANAGSPQPEKTIVMVDLVPLGERFDNTTAFLTSERFWHKQILLKTSYFGDYDVLYVRYPGLPPSPPMASSDMTIVDNGPYPGSDDDGRKVKPIAVDVSKRQDKGGLGAGAIAIISLSALVGLVLFAAFSWVLIVKRRKQASERASTQQTGPPSLSKHSGTERSVIGSSLSSASMSFQSSIAAYAGSAKTFRSSDIEKATNNFDNSRILGEGGFGVVYSGVLEDGTKVAVKVLKREDHHSGREFFAEVEMLSRLHHRNLVKLIGICTEERARCLVYELIPNGSVESHLHGTDKYSFPLDWDVRIKIALGSARGLAYLHEDSSPRVIHRDFKASNILLEHDFTPKVSDFGLARTAMDEENMHITTRVMGTFGYVAPEYAMTGHLLVKSDVYSYGVVLLELLTGRKPVDMSQPPGRENLVAWARPLLTSREGLEEMIDPSLGPDLSIDSVAKVAAIASMCVQPEVSHRPFMGEVVQALKLVCNECEEAKDEHSESFSHDSSADTDPGISACSSGHLLDPFHDPNLAREYDSEPDIESGLPLSDLFGASASYNRYSSGSFRMHSSSSGPLVTGTGRKLWQKMRKLRGESVSEHGIMFKSWPGSR